MNRNTRTLIVLLVAIVTASVATALVYQAIRRRPVQQVQLPQAFVVAATHPLQTGTKISTSDVRLIGWPADAIVPGSFTRIEDVVDRGVLQPLQQNEPITETKVAAIGAGAGLPPTIPPGMRAISVRVNDVVGVAGFVTPGNVQVLTAGTKYEQDQSKGEPIPTSVVTLLLSPEDAEKVVLASTEGSIMLALRNPLDVAPTATPGTRLASLYGEPSEPEAPSAPRAAPRPRPAAPPPAAAPAPEPKPYTVEAIRGAKRTEEAIH